MLRSMFSAISGLRAHQTKMDVVGNLVTPDGGILQGWLADPATGQINNNGPVTDMAIPYGQVLAPVATTNGAAAGNLSADALVGDSVETQITMFDKLGNPHDVSYIFTKTAANKWDVDVKDGGTSVLTAPVSLDWTASNGLTPTPATVSTTSASWGTVAIDLSKVTQYGGKASVT